MNARLEGVLPVKKTIPIPANELKLRSSRLPNHQALNVGSALLARSMANSPQDALQEVAETILSLSQAHSVGISLFEKNAYRWQAVASPYALNLKKTTPWKLISLEAIWEAKEVQLLLEPDFDFDPKEPAITEALLVPFYIGEEPVGIIWAFLHDPDRQFDSEDAQVLKFFREFAATAVRIGSVSEASAIIESSDDAIISKDLQGIITSWNRGAERIFGYQAAEVIGKPISILAIPDRMNEMPEILAKLSRGEHIHHFETLRRRKDGRIIHVSLTISPIRDSEGRVIGASKSARDITEKKLADEERTILLEREREARKTAELLNRVAPKLIVELETERLVQVITDIATALVGAEVGVFVQNTVNSESPNETLANMSGIVRCDDVTLSESSLSQRLRQEISSPQDIRSYLAVPVILRSGEFLGCLFLGHSKEKKFTDDHEAIMAGVAAQAALAMDNARMFEQSQWVQTELKRFNDELRQANQALETFAYSASHDLQEPLRTIALSAQLFKRKCGTELREDAARFLADILSGANRMKSLIDDLLVYMKATKSTEGPPPEVDSGFVLNRVLKDLNGQIEEVKGVVTNDSLPMVQIHESRLVQVFQNLISNALKYRNQETPVVHVSAQEKDGHFVFSVTDNGIGIEQEYANQIFEPFRRLHNRQQYAGSGIGLGLCRRIIEQYGGKVWLERSIPGKGSTFCFAIPAQAQ